MAVKMNVKPKLEIIQSVGEVEVEKSLGGKKGPKKTKQEVVSEAVFSEPTANVGMSISHTINLGNYESVRVQVSLHMPSSTDVAALNKTFDSVKEWVDSKLGNVVDEINSVNGAKNV